jgi:hypothetical protein
MNSNIKLTGKLKVELIRDGKVIQVEEKDNIITTAGKNALASLLIGTSQGLSLVTHMGFGTGVTPVAIGDTTIQTELVGNGYTRPIVTRTNPTANVVQYVSNLTGISVSTTVQQAGLMSAVTGGTLFAHQLTGAVTLASASDSLQVTWQVTIS